MAEITREMEMVVSRVGEKEKWQNLKLSRLLVVVPFALPGSIAQAPATSTAAVSKVACHFTIAHKLTARNDDDEMVMLPCQG